MKLSLYARAAAVLCALAVVGCGQQKTGAARQQGGGGVAQQPSNQDQTMSPRMNGADSVKIWSLADGRQFSGKTEGSGRTNEPLWIWCDASPGPVSYRIVSNGVGGEWKEMRQSDVTDDDKLIDDPTGNFGAVETLPAGNYSIEFKVETEEFSQLSVTIK